MKKLGGCFLTREAKATQNKGKTKEQLVKELVEIGMSNNEMPLFISDVSKILQALR